MTKQIILWNNLYNKNCCSSCKRICPVCRIKINRDVSGNINNYLVNGKRINITNLNFSKISVFLINGKKMRKNEYVFLKRKNIIQIAFYNNKTNKYGIAISKNSNKLKCLKIPIDNGEPFYGRLIRNNKIFFKNVLLQI